MPQSSLMRTTVKQRSIIMRDADISRWIIPANQSCPSFAGFTPDTSGLGKPRHFTTSAGVDKEGQSSQAKIRLDPNQSSPFRYHVTRSELPGWDWFTCYCTNHETPELSAMMDRAAELLGCGLLFGHKLPIIHLIVRGDAHAFTLTAIAIIIHHRHCFKHGPNTEAIVSCEWPENKC